MIKSIAISIGLWLAKVTMRSLLKEVSATLQDKLKPVADDLKTAAAKTTNTIDDKVAGFFADVVGAE